MNPCYFPFKINFNIILHYVLSFVISSFHLLPKTTILTAFPIFAISGGLGKLFKLQILCMPEQSHAKSVIKFTPYFEYYWLYGTWCFVVWYRGRYELASCVFRVTFHLYVQCRRSQQVNPKRWYRSTEVDTCKVDTYITSQTRTVFLFHSVTNCSDTILRFFVFWAVNNSQKWTLQTTQASRTRMQIFNSFLLDTKYV